jgi:hypothetical protein
MKKKQRNEGSKKIHPAVTIMTALLPASNYTLKLSKANSLTWRYIATDIYTFTTTVL